MMSSAAWGGQDQAMGSTEDDFQQFLDMSGIGGIGDGMHFDFESFQDSSAQSLMGQPRQSSDTIMGNTGSAAMIPRSDGLLPHHTSTITSAATHATIPAHMMVPAAPTDAISNIDAQIQYLQQQKFQQQQRQLQEQQVTFFANHGHSIPPTPQSLEMAPGSSQFYSKADQVSQRGSYDRNYHQRIPEQQDMAFTPLVSPAVTPLDPHFNMDNTFAVPNNYFSPLTSPALHAQNDSSSACDLSTRSNNSPIELDLDPPAMPVATNNADLAKKARKNNATKARPKTNIKNSPISKPQRRKTGPSPAIVSRVLSEVDERSITAADQTLLPLPAASTDGSEENASVSPESLTEMPPPPIPARRSNSKSPYIQAQGSTVRSSHPMVPNEETTPHPATPASLMKLPASKTKKQTTNHLEPAVSDNIESLELPESVSTTRVGPIMSRITSQSPRLEPNPPRVVAFQTQPQSQSQSQPSPAARISSSASTTQSPLLQPGSSSSSSRKSQPAASRNSRKRSSGSVHVSPALLPRISPNIKPLLPGSAGMSAEDQASRLLMSKSNYQNILEGNQVPGVSYPSELSTNLTSKRTSHKIAEQGRRNRINNALQIMAGLLPESKGKIISGDDSDKKEGKQSNVSNSKASVVENAIVHMQKLEKENGDLKQELKALRDRLEKLARGEGGEEKTGEALVKNPVDSNAMSGVVSSETMDSTTTPTPENTNPDPSP